MVPTIWALFETEVLRGPLASDIVSSPPFEGLRRSVALKVDPTFWTSARTATEDGLRKLLDISLVDVLVAGWAKHQKLRELLQSQPERSDEIQMFDLGAHSITSTHKPRIQVRVLNQPIGELPFELRLELELKVARLHIRQRTVHFFSVGGCRGKGSLKLGDVKLADLKSKEIPLSGDIPIPNGFRLS
jgi:hypothetical protein